MPYGQVRSSSLTESLMNDVSASMASSRGDFPGLMPAHAVGDGEQPQRGIGDEAILVDLAHPAGIGHTLGSNHVTLPPPSGNDGQP